jgi:hypothetical protein
MKTKKIRLIVTMVTLTAAIAITTSPSYAQRRNSKDSRNDNVTSTKSGDNKPNPEKSASANKRENNDRNDRVQKAPGNSRHWDMERNSRPVEQSSRAKAPERENQSARPDREKRNTNEAEQSHANRDNERNANVVIPERNRRENPAEKRERYNTRTDRDIPSKDYKGSDRYWSGDDHRDRFMNDDARNRDLMDRGHWNHSWEGFRWNERSWQDYYHGYRPYSFRYDRYYFHHPTFGDVLRRFLFKPVVFVYHRIPYYCYDGYFFAYHRGVGYVLTDIPYGIVFPELPYGYEEVYINGYLYYRIGNLFFEFAGDGYRLIYYPERFLAYR